jgi:hypothetical protein
MFREAIRTIALLMQESTVLEIDEQDQIGVVFVNLEGLGLVYGTPMLKPDLAKDVLALIDTAIDCMGKHGLLTGEVDKPWKP